MPVLVVFGDSVPWGQGLLDGHKFATLVQQGLRERGQELEVEMLAHSGATIGARGPDALQGIDGEVPVAYPTIIEQVAMHRANPEDVDLILINGGINDVNFLVLMNPLTSHEHLGHLVTKYCYTDMRMLLDATVTKFHRPQTRVVVTGYYPILSRDSEVIRAHHFIQTLGIAAPDFVERNVVFDKIVSLCRQFWQESNASLKRAVDDCNADGGDGRLLFVNPGFSEKNAVFASDPWLFGLDGNTRPQDEVIAARQEACKRNVHDIIMCAMCERASAGHPNPTGAAKYASAILETLHAAA